MSDYFIKETMSGASFHFVPNPDIKVKIYNLTNTVDFETSTDNAVIDMFFSSVADLKKYVKSINAAVKNLKGVKNG